MIRGAGSFKLLYFASCTTPTTRICGAEPIAQLECLSDSVGSSEVVTSRRLVDDRNSRCAFIVSSFEITSIANPRAHGFEEAGRYDQQHRVSVLPTQRREGWGGYGLRPAIPAEQSFARKRC